MQTSCLQAGKKQQVPSTFLLHVTLLLCSSITAQNLPGNVSSGPNKTVVLSPNFPNIKSNDFISDIEWKKVNGSSSQLLVHIMPNNTQYFSKRAKWDFRNLSLILENVQKDDGGVYEIKLVFENGNVISQKVTLTIISPPQLRILINKTKPSEFRLQCELGDSKAWSRKWLQNGRSLPQIKRYSLSEDSAILWVTVVTEKDCGNYSCVATHNASGVQFIEKVMDLCSGSMNLTEDQKETHLPVYLYVSVLPAGIVVLLSVVLICFIKHTGCCKKDQTVEDSAENHIYDEIKDQSQATPPKAKQLPYVYCTYTLQQPSLSTSSAEQSSEAVYSCIGLTHTQALNTTNGSVDTDG